MVDLFQDRMFFEEPSCRGRSTLCCGEGCRQIIYLGSRGIELLLPFVVLNVSNGLWVANPRRICTQTCSSKRLFDLDTSSLSPSSSVPSTTFAFFEASSSLSNSNIRASWAVFYEEQCLIECVKGCFHPHLVLKLFLRYKQIPISFLYLGFIIFYYQRQFCEPQKLC